MPSNMNWFADVAHCKPGGPNATPFTSTVLGGTVFVGLANICIVPNRRGILGSGGSHMGYYCF